MKRLNLLGAALLAVLAIAAVTAGAASAAFPNSLPTGATFNNTSGTTEFGSGITAIKSTADKGSGVSTGEKTGTFKNTFEKSKDQLGSTCTGLSATDQKTPGNVTVEGESELRFDTTKTKVLALFKLSEVHLSCGSILIKVKGCVAGVYTSALNTPLKEATVTLTVEKGDNVPVLVENKENTGTENCELKAEINDTSPSLSSEKGVETLKEFAKGLGAGKNEVEIMTK